MGTALALFIMILKLKRTERHYLLNNINGEASIVLTASMRRIATVLVLMLLVSWSAIFSDNDRSVVFITTTAVAWLTYKGYQDQTKAEKLALAKRFEQEGRRESRRLRKEKRNRR